MTLPVALAGADVIGQAKTGTGKTLGFGLPLLERVTVPADVEAGRAAPEDLTDAPQALVVVPTRELCTQVTNDLLTAGKVRNVRVLAIYGGRAYEPQVEALKKGVDVVVGTPGRLLDLAGQKKLNLKHIRSLVLDEADEMLDLGFLPDVEKIIDMLPVKRQTMLFSATMPGAVIGLARRYMNRPTHIRATAPDDEGFTVANIKQFVYRAHNMDKPEMVARILQAEGRGLAMIFCRTKRTAADIAEQLQNRGFAAGAVHGDLGQGAREQALRAFRNGKVDVLVCTDVAARGIDVEGVTHVINYQSPEDEKTYLHRVGRTGRAGAKGTAITFVDWDDIPRWQLINKALELDFNDPVETYSSSPHLFSDLGIPEGTKGTLPRSERTRAGLDAEELEDLGEPGGRGGRGGRGRGGRPEARGEARTEERERSRTPRRRRRTRGGTPLDATPATEQAPAGEQAPATADEAGTDTAPRTLRRRRRTRGGASAPAAQAAEAAVTPVTQTAPAQAEAGTTAVEAEPVATAVAASEGAALGADTASEAPAKPRRRRTRKSAEATEAPQTEAPQTEAAQAPEAPAEPEAPAAAPRRRTRKTAVATETPAEAAETAASAAASTAEGVTEAVEAKPKTRRTRKTAATAAATEAAEAAADTAEATEAKPKTRRTRKTAATAATAETAPAAEAAVDTAEATEAKPKTRRTRKTAATTETAPAADAEAAEAKPRRTRKTAAKAPAAEAAAETAVDTAEATEAKPKTRRTRKTAATAATEAAEAAVDTAEATEAKPKARRTRKTAATAATTETAEATPADATEAKPKTRRTRKVTAAGPATAGIPAQATQEPVEAKPRRTRKSAATEPVDGAEAKPKARRTRKVAAAAESTEG
ncbi:DEAD/DEAH box helicase [Streptomyces griseosporeus]|uniref:DEAD/DEAH box helicase n=1 Tax=Streptomyces griseosporeus TaxID=1910 RepID=UPI0036FABBA8